MTIDEAIAHAREVVENNRKTAEECLIFDRFQKADECVMCAEEHEQLAEWLEELKAYREIGTVEECRNSVLDIEKSYNKAIDDFAEKFIYKAVCEGCSGCCNCYEESRQNECEDYKAYMEIAEQLKVGGENDNIRK